MTSHGIKAIVVGGGLSGLGTACYLAQAGCDVRLLERAGVLGGRARTKRHDGFALNLGPHALYTGGAMTQALNELGVSYGERHGPSGIKMLSSSGFDLMPDSTTSLIRTHGLRTSEKFELMRLLGGLGKHRPRELGHVSVQTWIEQHTTRPAVRELLVAIARTAVYCSNLDLVSADVFIDKMQRLMKSPIHYLDGGWATLVEGLVQKATELGIEIITQSPVTSLTVEGGRVSGVRERSGAQRAADVVVLAVEPGAAVSIAPEHLGSLTCDLLPAEVACLDVALSGLPNRDHAVVQDIQEPRFMSTQSCFAKVAPDGAALITSFKQLDPTDSDSGESRAELEALLDSAQPGWRDVSLELQYLPRITAVGGLPQAKNGGFAGRPTPRVPSVQGLFITGDWVGDTGFLADTCFASAREAAQLITAEMRDVRVTGTPSLRP